MTPVPTKEDIMLQYRVAVLEDLVGWMLKCGTFSKELDEEEMKQIHDSAVETVRQRYPYVNIRFQGKWLGDED